MLSDTASLVEGAAIAKRSARATPSALLVRRTRDFRRILARARRSEDADAIHDLRVAARRLSEAISLFGAERSRAGKAARDGVAAVRRAAAKLRDRDVWIEWLGEARARARSEAAAVESLLAGEVARRKKGVRRFRSRLRQAGVDRLAKALAALTRSGEKTKDERGTGPAPDALALPALLAERSARAATIAARAARSGDAEELHEARIAIKRLRYAAEAVALSGFAPRGGSAPLLSFLKKLQSVLGELHDRDVFLDKVARCGEKLVARKKKARREDLRKSFEALSSRLSRERERLVARFRRLVAGRDGALARELRVGLVAPGAARRRDAVPNGAVAGGKRA